VLPVRKVVDVKDSATVQAMIDHNRVKILQTRCGVVLYIDDKEQERSKSNAFAETDMNEVRQKHSVVERVDVIHVCR
jgi:hypothetical protein